MVDPRWAICRNRTLEGQICCQVLSFRHSGSKFLHAQQEWCPVTSQCWIDLTCPCILTPAHEKCRCALVLTPFWAAGHVATGTDLQINSWWSSKDAEFHKRTCEINNMPVCHLVKKLFAVDVYVNSRVLCKKRRFLELISYNPAKWVLKIPKTCGILWAYDWCQHHGCRTNGYSVMRFQNQHHEHFFRAIFGVNKWLHRNYRGFRQTN